MAVMKPEIDPARIPFPSEQVVYVALRDQLPKDYVVLHSYPWLRPDRDGVLREGEADFVILHPQRGLLVLEVKGGELDYRNGAWHRKHKYGWKAITDPFAQARKSMHVLLDVIERRSSHDLTRNDLTYGYAVVFPHHDYKGPEPPGSDPAIIVTQPQLAAIAPVIEPPFSQWPAREQALTPPLWGRLLQAILPQFRLYRPVAVDVDSTYRQIDELTDEQVEAFRALYADNRRVYIPGVAGSGKTRFALDRALRFAQEKQRTLLVCYNKHLSELLEELVASSPFDRSSLEYLHIRHFHKLARDLIRDAELSFEVPVDQSAELHFWKETVPDQLEQAVMLLMDERTVQYEAIVIDEGQDFHPRWWECLNYTLLKDIDKGWFYAFADPDQSLWDWSLREPPIPFATVYRLNRNCRNTRLIARSSAIYAHVETELYNRLPLGLIPGITTVPQAVGMKGIVLGIVRQLLGDQHLQPRQIAIIGPSRWQNGSLASAMDIDSIPFTESPSEWRRGGHLLITTARSFKGLEADAVVVYDLNGFGDWFGKTDLYVACTRARSYLHLITLDRQLADVIGKAVERARSELE